jgi:hypothetical protein
MVARFFLAAPWEQPGVRRFYFFGWNQGTPELLLNSRKEVFMKNWFAIMAFLAAVVVVNPANARPGGCVKGAIVGGIVGHFTGHTGVGAATGCAYGLHHRHQYDRQEQGRSIYEQRDTNRRRGYSD